MNLINKKQEILPQFFVCFTLLHRTQSSHRLEWQPFYAGTFGVERQRYK